MFKKIGIIGGAGPIAGALLLKKIIQHCQRVYQSKHDRDFPEIILESVPFSQMLEPGLESEVKKELSEHLHFLDRSGALKMVIACHTLHSFLPEIQPFPSLVHLVQETKAFLKAQQMHDPVVFCTETSKRYQIYQEATYPSPEIQKTLNFLIDRGLEGLYVEKDKALFESVLQKLDIETRPCILGCTELSVLWDTFSDWKESFCVIDPLELILEKLVEKTLNLSSSSTLGN